MMKRILLFYFLFYRTFHSSRSFDKNRLSYLWMTLFNFQLRKAIIKKNVIVKWSIAEGYYLYQEKISVKLNQAETSSFDVPTFSISPEDYNDPYFGLMKIFKKPVQAILKQASRP